MCHTLLEVGLLSIGPRKVFYFPSLPPTGNQWRRSSIRHLGTSPLGVTGSPEGFISRRKPRSPFDQVSKFNRGRIVAYQDCELSFREIGSRVGRNQTTVMRICDSWMPEGKTDRRRGRSYPPHLLRHQWCDERRVWVAEWNEVVFTDESRICLQHHDGLIRVWSHRGERILNSCVMLLPTGPAPGIMINARPHVARNVQKFFVNNQIELLPWPARSPDLLPIENMWSMIAQRLAQITPPAATPDQLWQRVETAWSDVPQDHIRSLFE
ncbi:transposable element Tcb1 transposase [Trichonephila clavipes]|nr:transposable element Tcb1 transposase [Trichonephila clavipes]